MYTSAKLSVLFVPAARKEKKPSSKHLPSRTATLFPRRCHHPCRQSIDGGSSKKERHFYSLNKTRRPPSMLLSYQYSFNIQHKRAYMMSPQNPLNRAMLLCDGSKYLHVKEARSLRSHSTAYYCPFSSHQKSKHHPLYPRAH